jgi:hypothetical protein
MNNYKPAMSKRYYKIIESNGLPFTYGKDVVDPETLKRLENSFVSDFGLMLFGRPHHLIADVDVESKLIQYRQFLNINPNILYANEIKTSNIRRLDEEKKLEPAQTNLPKLNQANLSEQFQTILTALNVNHKVFKDRRYNIYSSNNYLYPEFNPENYLREEIIMLQKKMSEALRRKDEYQAKYYSLLYHEKSKYLDQNISHAKTKLFNILYSFNSSTMFVSKLVFDDEFVLRMDPVPKNDDEYQKYLNTLTFFVAHLMDHPIFDPID